MGSYSLLRIYIAPIYSTFSLCRRGFSLFSPIYSISPATSWKRAQGVSRLSPKGTRDGSSQNNRYWLFRNIPHLICRSSICLKENPDLDVRLREVSPSSPQGWNQSWTHQEYYVLRNELWISAILSSFWSVLVTPVEFYVSVLWGHDLTCPNNTDDSCGCSPLHCYFLCFFVCICPFVFVLRRICSSFSSLSGAAFTKPN